MTVVVVGCSGDRSPTSVDIGQVVGAGPQRSGDDFRLPTPREADQLTAAWLAVLAGRLDDASRLARPLGYAVRGAADEEGGADLVVLEERGKESRRGWGVYVHAPGSTSRLVVEVPHPSSDLRTVDHGVELFRRSGGRALLVAGAHRDAGGAGEADVARQRETLFHRLHAATVTPTSVVYQTHGFADDTSPGHDVVVSTGARPTEMARELTRRLEAASFDTCLFDIDRCRELGATTNVQGRHTRAAGAAFLHVELARRLRDDPWQNARVAHIAASTIADARG